MIMKYIYCPKCDILRPKTFLMGDRCEGCRDDAVTIEVARSIYGKLMYLTSGVAIALLALFLAQRDYGIDLIPFLSEMNETLFIVLIFVTIFLAFAFSFLDLGRTGKEARRIVDERKERKYQG
jgi:hypothetical protein